MGRLFLALEDEVCPNSVSNLFCLQKPDGELRQIIDRRPRNSIEEPPPADAPKMGHASVFLGLQVPKGGCIRGSVDDLRNFYHEFVVSDERARSTPVGPLWFARDFHGSAALQELQKRRPGVRISANTRVRSCFAGLSMGDHWAPAIAQVAHEQLLMASRALVKEEHLVLGSPIPRSPSHHFSGVCIDDKLSLQVFPEHVPANDDQVGSSCRDLQALAQADAAYSKVGLECHPKKRLRRADNFKAWGAHFDGNACLVGMDRTKLVMLSFLTALLAQKGVVSERLLQKVLGLWAFALQFRRPLFSLLHAAYHVGHPEGCPVSPFRMPRTLQVELWMLSVLGPLSITNLKAQVSPFVYATDASPDGAGIVCANVGQEVASELFRRADNRGFHTRLLSPPGAALQECGIEPEEPLDWPAQASEPCSSTNLTHWVLLPPPSDDGDFATELGIAESQELWQRFLSACLASRAFTVSAFQLDFLEVYAGTARLSQAFLVQGFRVGPPIDLKLGWDLDNELFGFPRTALQDFFAGPLSKG